MGEDDGRNWSVAVVGAGPAGLYAADSLMKRGARVDVFEQGFAPYGLVRYGVAPDHQKIKKTEKVFLRVLSQPRLRLFGNVRVGSELQVSELLEAYDQVVFAHGSPGARDLGIPGEDLAGSVTATEFVNWYNGQPGMDSCDFGLASPRVVVIGMGNVAIDVARILVRRTEELAATDIAPYALKALGASRVREVVLLARRGPNQAAFDEKEVRELAALEGVEVGVRGYVSKRRTRMSDFIASLPKAEELHADARRVVLHFCASPRELVGTEQVSALRWERNDLVESALRMKAVGSGEFAALETGLVVRAIGYQGARLPGLPFREDTGTVPNTDGRVLKCDDGPAIPGLYVTGWIKRGPTGLIGTNKACAVETVDAMEADLDQVGPLRDPETIPTLLAKRGVRHLGIEDWLALDREEVRRGALTGKPREKFLGLSTVLEFLEGAHD